MSFVVHGKSLADVRVDSVTGQAALGFGRLLIDLELLVRERRHVDQPTLVEVGGELFMRDHVDTPHYLGRVHAARPPVAIELGQHAALLGLEVELDPTRLDALEKLRLGQELTLELVLRGRLTLAGSTALVATSETHRLSQTAWDEIL